MIGKPSTGIPGAGVERTCDHEREQSSAFDYFHR